MNGDLRAFRGQCNPPGSSPGTRQIGKGDFIVGSVKVFDFGPNALIAALQIAAATLPGQKLQGILPKQNYITMFKYVSTPVKQNHPIQ